MLIDKEKEKIPSVEQRLRTIEVHTHACAFVGV